MILLRKNREQMKESPLYSEDYTLRGNISEQKKNKQREELKNKIGYIV
jgi:acetyltransferase (isoleucine patch superfamily)